MNIVTQAEKYVRELLTAELTKDHRYHNLTHTLMVREKCIELSNKLSLNEEEREIKLCPSAKFGVHTLCPEVLCGIFMGNYSLLTRRGTTKMLLSVANHACRWGQNRCPPKMYTETG